jgi:hypothetical protein
MAHTQRIIQQIINYVTDRSSRPLLVKKVRPVAVQICRLVVRTTFVHMKIIRGALGR